MRCDLHKVTQLFPQCPARGSAHSVLASNKLREWNKFTPQSIIIVSTKPVLKKRTNVCVYQFPQTNGSQICTHKINL